MSFNDSASALKFVKSAHAEGYRFFGQELVDSEYKLVKYVYFVRVSGGRFEPAGQDPACDLAGLG